MVYTSNEDDAVWARVPVGKRSQIATGAIRQYVSEQCGEDADRDKPQKENE